MECYRQTVSSAELSSIFSLPLSLRNKKVDVIILPVDNYVAEVSESKRQFDFVDAPPLPDSFFDPLPEEELQAWGL